MQSEASRSELSYKIKKTVWCEQTRRFITNMSAPTADTQENTCAAQSDQIKSNQIKTDDTSPTGAEQIAHVPPRQFVWPGPG